MLALIQADANHQHRKIHEKRDVKEIYTRGEKKRETSHRYGNGLKRSALEMFISVFVSFASTTVKIYLEFSENELFEKMKGFVAIVSKIMNNDSAIFYLVH